MAGAEDAEIAAVEGGDSGDAQALGDRHDAAVKSSQAALA